MPVSSFCEYIFNINIGRKTNKTKIGRKNQIQLCRLSLQKNQICKLFILTDEAITWDMSAMP